MPAELGADATAGRLEAVQVRAMFDRVAAVYDPLNTLMTAGLHHRWRVRAADLACVAPGSRVLDVATGTGDLAIELARRVAPGGEVVGSDFSESMLSRARVKGEKAVGGMAPRGAAAVARSGAASSPVAASAASSKDSADAHSEAHSAHASEPVVLRFEWGDALRLPYDDSSFDAATVGFGARNFSDLRSGLAEMARVVRPGGRVVVLDFTTPTRPPLSLFYRVWFDRLVPLLGRVTAPLAALAPKSDDASKTTIAEAYTYLPNSVKRFGTPSDLAAEMERVGLVAIHYLITAGGIVTIHAATVPEDGIT
jgi:demethylmenaquinone methyltransferase/2-methoxy-6-polyprenyl-1,4-benzoquinol methylase